MKRMLRGWGPLVLVGASSVACVDPTAARATSGGDPNAAAIAAYPVSGTYVGEHSVALTLTIAGHLAEVLQEGFSASFVFLTPVPEGEVYAVAAFPVVGERCAVQAGNGTLQAPTDDLFVACGIYITRDTGAVATAVTGQTDFTTTTPRAGTNGLTAPMGLWQPKQNTDFFYVVDAGNNRLLQLSQTAAVITGGLVPALQVIEQPDPTTTAPGLDAVHFSAPAALDSNGAELAIVDAGNNRVLLFDAFPTAGVHAADTVLGQAAFDTATAACGPSSLAQPTGVALTGAGLAVADTQNHRVLLWNAQPTRNAQPPDAVLGQPNAQLCTAAAPAATTLNAPGGVWSDGKRLVVADTGNHRVLIWDTVPTATATPADIVVGQPSMTSNDPATTAAGMRAPQAVTSNTLQLFVADTGNQRVLVYDTFPTASGALADAALGQPSLTASGARATADGLAEPLALRALRGTLVVADRANNRLVSYGGPETQ